MAIILAIALVIGWEEKRGQTQADQCRAYYTAQESRRIGFSVNNDAAEQEAIAAACEPNGYFYRLFGPTNLPSLLLVIVGLGGIWVAMKTIRAIERQIIIPNRAYLRAGEPALSGGTIFKFPIENYGHIAGRVVSVSVEIIVQIARTGREVERLERTIQDKTDIIPGVSNEVALSIEILKLERQRDYVVAVTLVYETGFGESDKVTFVRVFNSDLMRWVTAATTIEISFVKAKDDKQNNPHPN
ncbi:MAG TPA: hypothetical protein VMJ93_16895 [Verrucomicrobiae bacterium]|nr:hypothetical protein [Verrucomicrobiae bacterium]